MEILESSDFFGPRTGIKNHGQIGLKKIITLLQKVSLIGTTKIIRRTPSNLGLNELDCCLEKKIISRTFIIKW